MVGGEGWFCRVPSALNAVCDTELSLFEQLSTSVYM